MLEVAGSNPEQGQFSNTVAVGLVTAPQLTPLVWALFRVCVCVLGGGGGEGGGTSEISALSAVPDGQIKSCCVLAWTTTLLGP